MKNTNKISFQLGSLFASVVLIIGIITANTACFSIWHQPKEPECMNKFKI